MGSPKVPRSPSAQNKSGSSVPNQYILGEDFLIFVPDCSAKFLYQVQFLFLSGLCSIQHASFQDCFCKEMLQKIFLTILRVQHSGYTAFRSPQAIVALIVVIQGCKTYFKHFYVVRCTVSNVHLEDKEEISLLCLYQGQAHCKRFFLLGCSEAFRGKMIQVTARETFFSTMSHHCMYI